MEQQGEGLEEWSDAAGKDDAAEYEAAADYEAAEVDDMAEEDVGAVWETQQDAETVAWDEGEGGALDTGADTGGWRPATGEPRVDAALARLDELTNHPVTEHRAIFEDVHRRLRDVLGELDTREHGSGEQPAAAGAERRAGR